MRLQDDADDTIPFQNAYRRRAELTALLRRALRAVAVPFVVLALLFEEWGWAPLAAAAAWLGRLPILRNVEKWIAGLPPRAALLAFAVPAVALLPVKLAALWLFGAGHVASGVVLLIGAKLAGTALVARLFVLTQPALMQISWFAHWYPRWKHWKDDLLRQVHESAMWHATGRLRRRVQGHIAAWWSRTASRTGSKD